MIEKVLPALVDLDRRVASLEDWSSLEILLEGEEAKSAVVNIRAKWHEQHKKARDEYDASNDANVKFTHPMGMPLRTAMVCTMLEIMQKEVGDGPGSSDLKGAST